MSTYLRDLQLGLLDIFKTDQRVILLGEDVIDPYGGAFKVTAGLSTAFPDRVLSTPISEAGITGLATGLALRGYVPLVEIMFGDFLTLCADQIVNHATKFPQMYENVTCPLIIRTPMGGGRGYGPTHSQTIEKMFLGVVGLKVIAPSHFHRPGQTLVRVIAQENNPVLFIEHKLLYGETLHCGTTNLPLSIETDETGYQTAVLRNYTYGSPDVCVISYGGVSRFLPGLMTELATEEIRVMAVLPESVDPVPVETLTRLAVHSGRVVIVDEACGSFTWASSLASLLYEKLWGGGLQCPIKVVTSERSIIPTSFDKEAEMLISKSKIEKAILEAVSWA